MEHRNRIAKWDNAKAFLIICVVIGHLAYSFAEKSRVLTSLQLWIYSFHMPAFFFLSGLFSKRTVREHRWERIAPYLLLYLVMKLLEYAATVFAYGREKASFSLLFEDGVPWFALALFFCMAVTALFAEASPVFVVAVAAAAALLVGYLPQHSSFLALERTAVFYPFFYAGVCVREEDLREMADRQSARIIAFIVLIVSAAAAWFFAKPLEDWILLFRGRYTYGEIGMIASPAWGAVWRLCGYAVSLATGFAVLMLAPGRKLLYLTVLGQTTLSVYALHNPLNRCILAPFLPVRRWIGSGHVALRCLLVAAAVIVITALPVFTKLFKALMDLPGKIRE